MKVKNHIPELVQEYRDKVGYIAEQKEIAAAADVSDSTLSRYIRGVIAAPNLEMEYRLCRFFSRVLGREITRADLFSFDFDRGEPEKEGA
jgi:transcriptional regulator with XRE-family HTH domain